MTKLLKKDCYVTWTTNMENVCQKHHTILEQWKKVFGTGIFIVKVIYKNDPHGQLLLIQNKEGKSLQVRSKWLDHL